MKKIFYDSVTNNEIVDLKGTKTIAFIEQTYGLSNVQEVTLNSGEAQEIVNGVLQKFNLKNRNDAEKITKDAEKKAKKDSIIVKLKITEADFEELREALN